jgi:hypothetical protein
LKIKEREGFIKIAPPATSTGYLKVKDIDPETLREETLIMLDEIAATIISLL